MAGKWTSFWIVAGFRCEGVGSVGRSSLVFGREAMPKEDLKN